MATDVSAPLPAVTPADSTIYTVATGDSAAKIITFTIHLSQDAPADLLQALEGPVLLGYVPLVP